MALVLMGSFFSAPGFAQAPVDLRSKAETGMTRIEAPENMKKLELNIVMGERLKPPPQYSRAIIVLKEALNKWTTIPVGTGPIVRLATPEIMNRPILIISTDQQFELTASEISSLREYIEKGGFLFFDDAGADVSKSPSGATMLAAVREIAGGHKVVPVSPDHPIFQTPFLFGSAPPGLKPKTEKLHADRGSWRYSSMTLPDTPKDLMGVFIEGKLALLYSPRGYYAMWNDSNHIAQLKFGVNIVMYALGLE
jgi:hypothetical protein